MTSDAVSRFAKIHQRAVATLAEEGGFARRVTFDFGADGVIHVDGPAGEVREVAAEDDCRVTVSLDDFTALAKGVLDPAKAFLRGKIKIDGDLGLALELARRLRDGVT